MRITGRQLTVMVVAVCTAAVLTPAAVNAATGSSVNITDPVNASAKARVGAGKLWVTDGAGAMTVDGTVKTTDGSGAMTVDGTVVTADPATSWTVFDEIANDGSQLLLIKDIAANAGVTLGSLTLSHTSGTGPGYVRIRARQPNTPGDCAGPGVSQAEVASFAVPEGDTRTITFSPRFRVPKQTAESCLYLMVVVGGGTHTFSIQATGATY